jgi:hypothetical protein
MVRTIARSQTDDNARGVNCKATEGEQVSARK